MKVARWALVGVAALAVASAGTMTVWAADGGGSTAVPDSAADTVSAQAVNKAAGTAGQAKGQAAAGADDEWTEPSCIVSMNGGASVQDGKLVIHGWAVCSRPVEYTDVRVSLWRQDGGGEETEVAATFKKFDNLQLTQTVEASVDCDGISDDTYWRGRTSANWREGVENTEHFFATGAAVQTGFLNDAC